MQTPVPLNPTEVTTAQLTQLRFHARQLSLPPKKRANSSQAGAYLSSIRGRGMEFEETRQYQPGDDIRLMDWRVTARTGKPHTKVFRDERERPVIVLNDFSTSMYFGTRNTYKSCIAAQVASMIGWATIQHGDRIGSVIYHNNDVHELRPTGGQRGVFNLINQLRQSTNAHPTTAYNNLSLPLRHLRQVCKPGTMIFIISDFWQFDEEIKNELSQLARHNDVFCTIVSDPVELNHLPAGRYPIQSVVGDSWLDTKSARRQNLLQSFLDERMNNIQTFCRQRQLNLLQVSTADSVPQTLIDQMGSKTK